MSNISSGSFQTLELKVMSLAAILNIRRLRNGILAVELVGLSEKKKGMWWYEKVVSSWDNRETQDEKQQ